MTVARPIPCACAVCALVLCAGSAAWGQSARQLETQGREAFENHSFDEAAAAFEQAAAAAAEGKLDAAVAHYNRSLALARLGRHEEAAEAYVESLRTTDLQLQQPAYYNRGNALMAFAGAQETEETLEPALEAAREALAMFEKAITLDPGDTSAKTNFELALRKIEELESRLEQQQQNQQNEEDNESQEDQDQESDQDNESDSKDPQESEQKEDQDGQPDDQQDEQQDEQQDDQQDGQPESNSDNEQPPPDQGESQSQPRPSEEMTPEEAEMLLDAIREEEQSARERIRIKFGAGGPVEKDW